MPNRVTFVLDTTQTPMLATGHVAPVNVYNPDADRNAPRVQELDANGCPLWVADFLIDDEEAERAQVAGVRFPARGLPVFEKFRPVQFDRLAVTAYINKSTKALGLQFEGELKQQPVAKAA